MPRAKSGPIAQRRQRLYNLALNIAAAKIKRGDSDCVHTFPPAASLLAPCVQDFHLQGAQLVVWAPDIFQACTLPVRDVAGGNKGQTGCPFCGCALSLDGWADGLREVVGIEKMSYVLLRKYRCGSQACLGK